MIDKHLRFFIVAAEEEHFQRAAERLNIAQSALSRRIQDLERSLGNVKLFERLPRGIRLTESGREFYADVKRILDDLDAAAKRAARIARGEEGQLVISFNEMASRKPYLFEAIADFGLQNPKVSVISRPASSRHQKQLLLNREVDIAAIVDEGPRLAELDDFVLFSDNFLLAMPSTHRLAALNRKIYLKDLVDEDFVWLDRTENPELVDRMMALCEAQGFAPRIRAGAMSANMMFSLVSMQIGICFINSSFLGREPEGIRMVTVEDFSIPINLRLVWRSESKTRVYDDFFACVKRVMTRHTRPENLPAF